MIVQLDIFTVHEHETSPGNEVFLNANRKRLSKNCKILFEAFMAGQRITSFNSPVGDFRARVGDLRRVNGVDLHFDEVKIGGSTFKEWYMTEEDKSHNKKLLEDGNRK